MLSDSVTNSAHKKADAAGNEHFDLEEWPFYWLYRAHGRYQKKMEVALSSIELDVPTWRVLMLLEGENARSVSYLAEEAISKLSTMTRIVHRMQNNGLVKTRVSSEDGRVTEVLLTAHGRRARVLALNTADAMYAMAFKDFNAGSVKQLMVLLEQLSRNLK